MKKEKSLLLLMAAASVGEQSMLPLLQAWAKR